MDGKHNNPVPVDLLANHSWSFNLLRLLRLSDNNTLPLAWVINQLLPMGSRSKVSVSCCKSVVFTFLTVLV